MSASEICKRVKILEEDWNWKNMTLWDYVSEGNLPKAWGNFFDREDIQEILRDVSNGIFEKSKDCVVYPSPNHVFRTFNLPLNKIKVVIIGQDPYSCGNAVGICFSIPPRKKINQSLVNIYNELENEGYSPQRTGSLTHWMEQGCIMLNTALTVEKGTPESHLKIWYPFAEQVLEYISINTENVAWLLMGKHAAAFKKCTDKNGHKAFITSHPSPLSAYRPYQTYPAFIGSGIFKQINVFLGVKKIKW